MAGQIAEGFNDPHAPVASLAELLANLGWLLVLHLLDQHVPQARLSNDVISAVVRSLAARGPL